MYIMNAVCQDYVLATILTIVRRGLALIQVVVPIILIISGSIGVLRMVLNPDEKKNPKRLFNSFAAAVIVFLLPFVINLTMSTISKTGEFGINENGAISPFNISSCWDYSGNGSDQKDSSNDTVNTTIKEDEATSSGTCPEGRTCL